MSKNNSFEQTKAEKDIRASARETEEWLKSQNKEFKSTKPVKTSVSKPKQITITNNTLPKIKARDDLYKSMNAYSITKNGRIAVDDGTRISAGKQDRWDAKVSSKEEIEPKKENNGPDIGDFGNWLGKNVMKGIGKFNKGLMATADLIMPTEFLGKYDVFSNLNEYYSDLDKYRESESEKAAEKMGGKGWHTGGEILSSAVSAVPGMVMGGMLSGMNTTGALGSSTIGATSAVGTSNFWRDLFDDTVSATKQVVKNPEFGISFVENFGTNYENAISKGAKPAEAMASATMTTATNAGIDSINPQIFELLSKNKGYSKGIQNIGKLADGGLTGVFQGPVEPWVSNTIYNDAPFFSFEDENAIFNPSRMIDDFSVGAVTKGVGMLFDDDSDKIENSNSRKYNNTKKSTPKAEPKPFNTRMNEFRKRLNQEFISNSSLYGEEKASEMLTNKWNDYVNKLSDEDFDEYINIMKGE